MSTPKTSSPSPEYIYVRAVAPLPNYRLAVRLSNGRAGAFKAGHLLERGIARELKDPAYFAQVKLFHTGVGWPNGYDISPFLIDDELVPLAAGEKLPPLNDN